MDEPNSKQDYDNYFRRSLAVDANMRVHLESLISAALLEASNATKESQSVECVHSWKLEANQYVCMKCNLLNSIAEYRGKEKVTECAEFEEAWNKSSDAKNENSMLKRFANHWFSIGQKSKALKLPSEEEQRKFVDLHFCYSGLEYNSVGHVAKDAIELLKKFCDAVKSLNEGK